MGILTHLFLFWLLPFPYHHFLYPDTELCRLPLLEFYILNYSHPNSGCQNPSTFCQHPTISFLGFKFVQISMSVSISPCISIAMAIAVPFKIYMYFFSREKQLSVNFHNIFPELTFLLNLLKFLFLTEYMCDHVCVWRQQSLNIYTLGREKTMNLYSLARYSWPLPRYPPSWLFYLIHYSSLPCTHFLFRSNPHTQEIFFSASCYWSWSSLT